jgi:hypothetical protein
MFICFFQTLGYTNEYGLLLYSLMPNYAYTQMLFDGFSLLLKLDFVYQTKFFFLSINEVINYYAIVCGQRNFFLWNNLLTQV